MTLLSQFFPPETFAGANRVGAMADALAEAGDVTVVTLAPSYPDPAHYSDADVMSVSVGDRVTVHRTGAFAPHGRGNVSRAVGEQRMALGLARAALRFHTDVVVASSPGMFIGPAAFAVARARGAAFVWDIRDVTWTYARERAVRPPARVAASALERAMWSVARRADLLVAATTGIDGRLAAERLGTDVITVENAVGSGLWSLLDPSPPPAAERPAVVYAGLVGQAQSLDVLCDVAALAPEIDLHVAGDGPRRAAIEADAARRGLKNISFHGYLSPTDLAALYHRANVLFAQLHRSELHRTTALPSKLHEYMAAARPVVYAGDGLAADEIDRSGGGVVVTSGDAVAITDAIRGFVADPQRALAFGAAGRAVAERRPSRRQAMSPLVQAVERLAHKEAA